MPCERCGRSHVSGLCRECRRIEARDGDETFWRDEDVDADDDEEAESA